MTENRPLATFISHAVLIIGILIVAFPVWITFVAATHDGVRVTQVPFPLLPGDQRPAPAVRAVADAGLLGRRRPGVIRAAMGRPARAASP